VKKEKVTKSRKRGINCFVCVFDLVSLTFHITRVIE